MHVFSPGPKLYGILGAKVSESSEKGYLGRMIPKQHVPDLIGDGYRFSDKIMRQEKV
jgi:hypothetical protein